MRAFSHPAMAPAAKAALKPTAAQPAGTRHLIDGGLRARRSIGNRALCQLFEAAFGRRDDAQDGLEREADAIGAAIGAQLGPDAMAPGALPASARRVAESLLGPLPDITVSDGGGALPPGALASAAGTRIHLAEGALPSALPVYRAVLGHELVHLAQQRDGAGGGRQYLKVGQVEFPDVTVEQQAGASVLLVDRIPVLHCAGKMDAQVEYQSGPMQYLIAVNAGASVTRLPTLDLIGQRYPALEGRLVIGEPQTSLPSEGLAARAAAGERRQRTVLYFGRKPRAAAAPPLAAAASAPPAQPAANSAATAAPQRVPEASLAADASPYRQMTVAARAAKVGELLEKWLSSQEIEAVFRASASESEFLQLERAVDFQAVLEKLSEWEVIRLAAAGPILPPYAAVVNRKRAEYLARITREWGLPRAEVFATFIFDTTTNDEVVAVLGLLAGEQELGRTVGRMFALQLRLAQRGISLAQFKDRDWQAGDILTGLGHAASSVMNTAPAVADASGLAMMRQAGDMPEPYRQAVEQINMAAFMQSLTLGNMALGAADLAFLGLPSTVKGIVYDLPLALVAGIDELRQGHVAAGVELLTVPAVVVLSSALGLRAYRKSRVGALLELSGEGKALYDTLKTSIGVPGMQQVAGYIQRDAAARILAAEAGAEGILALHQSQGNVAAARALLQRPRPPLALALPPAAEAAGLGHGAIDLVYNPATNSWEMPARGKALRPSELTPAPSAAAAPALPVASVRPPVKPATPALAPGKALPQLGPGGPVPATVSQAQQRMAQAQQVLLRTEQQLDAARARGARRAELKAAEKGVKQAQTELAEAQRAHARLVQLESDLAALDAQLQQELNPAGGFSAAERQEGRRPNVYPPTGTASGKRFWNLKNREKRAQGEVASEVAQSTRTLRDQVEAATPGKTARPAALGNAAQLGLTKDGVPLDVTTGRPLTVKNWATDHIVSRDELALDQRFLRLTPRQRDILLLEIPENYLPMSVEANGSKGALSVDQWIAARQRSNQALPPAMADALRAADQRARRAIEAKYRELLPE